jgi:peptidase M28-like protein
VAVWLCGLLALLAVALGVGMGWSALGAAREDANLIAARPGGQVRRWLVAHVDTKAQHHSMAGRLVAVWVVGATVVALSGLSVARLFAPVGPGAAVAGAVLAVLGAALASRGRLHGQSAGARDNGSGLLAVLTAAELSADGGVGVLITGAEEFGLAGARILARMSGELLAGREVINVDTVDDEGTVYVIHHGERSGEFGARIARALAALELPVRARQLPVGILVDGVPLARAAGPTVTIGRLTWNTLRRIHTPRDTADDLTLDAAERIGRVIAAMN